MFSYLCWQCAYIAHICFRKQFLTSRILRMSTVKATQLIVSYSPTTEPEVKI